MFIQGNPFSTAVLPRSPVLYKTMYIEIRIKVAVKTSNIKVQGSKNVSKLQVDKMH